MQAEYAVVVGGNSMERTGLSWILRGKGLDYQVIELERCESLPEILTTKAIKLLVADAELDGWDIPESIRSVCATKPEIKVCMAVASLTRELAAKCIAAGAVGCVEKTQPADEIRHAFETISAGGIYLQNPTDDPSPDRQSAYAQDAASDPEALTPRQRSVLEVMAQGKSNKEIARILGIREGTVKVHLVAAYRSLGVRNRVAAVHAINSSPHFPNAINGQRGPSGPMLPMPGLGSSFAVRKTVDRPLAN